MKSAQRKLNLLGPVMCRHCQGTAGRTLASLTGK